MYVLAVYLSAIVPSQCYSSLINDLRFHGNKRHVMACDLIVSCAIELEIIKVGEGVRGIMRMAPKEPSHFQKKSTIQILPY